MIDGLLRDAMVTVRAKTGLTGTVVACAAIVAVCAAAAIIFLCYAAFLSLAQTYDALTASLVLGCGFFVACLIAVIAMMAARRQAVAQARAEAARHAWWADPKFVGIALEVGRAIGWRKIVPIALVGLIAAGLSKESARSGDH